MYFNGCRGLGDKHLKSEKTKRRIELRRGKFLYKRYSMPLTRASKYWIILILPNSPKSSKKFYKIFLEEALFCYIFKCIFNFYFVEWVVLILLLNMDTRKHDFSKGQGQARFNKFSPITQANVIIFTSDRCFLFAIKIGLSFFIKKVSLLISLFMPYNLSKRLMGPY